MLGPPAPVPPPCRPDRFKLDERPPAELPEALQGPPPHFRTSLNGDMFGGAPAVPMVPVPRFLPVRVRPRGGAGAGGSDGAPGVLGRNPNKRPVNVMSMRARAVAAAAP